MTPFAMGKGYIGRSFISPSPERGGSDCLRQSGEGSPQLTPTRHAPHVDLPLSGRGEQGKDMTYRAPVADIAFTLKHSAGLKRAMDEGLYGDLTEDVVDA